MKPEDRFYVYIHRRNDTKDVFYVGKGCGNRCSVRNRRSDKWKEVASVCGFTWEIIEKGLVEGDAYSLEQEAIKFYRECGHPLINLSTGGVGGQTGVKKSEEARANMRAKMKGRKFTEEQRKRMSLGAQRRAASPDDSEKRRTARANSPFLERTIAKIAEAKRKPVRCSNGLVFACVTEALGWLVSTANTTAALPDQIRMCCSGRKATAHGFSWSYITKQEYKDEIFNNFKLVEEDHAENIHHQRS